MGLKEHTRPLLDVYAISKVNRPTRQSAIATERKNLGVSDRRI
jgi:hypothetical protein